MNPSSLIARALTALLLAACGGPPPPMHAGCAEDAPPCPPCDDAAPTSEPPIVEAQSPSPVVRVGECPTEWLPSGVVRDVSPEETAELVELVRAWLAGPTARPLVDLQRGIVFVKTANDEGADPPYPQSSAPRSSRECGLSATWLRAHVRSMFAIGASPDVGGITCDENVCCMAGMEYVPNRAIVFHRVSGEDAAWVLESTYEVAEAALSDEVVADHRSYVARELARHRRGTCRGEPPGYF